MIVSDTEDNNSDLNNSEVITDDNCSVDQVAFVVGVVSMKTFNLPFGKVSLNFSHPVCIDSLNRYFIEITFSPC